jgi:hypothetical protein
MHQRAAECKKHEKPKTGRYSLPCSEATASSLYLAAPMSRLIRTVAGSSASSKSAAGAGSND